MQERRKFPRVSHRFELDVQPAGGSGTGRDVSKGGVSFIRKEKVEEGSLLDLAIRVPGLTGAFKVKGKVIRCLPEGDHYSVAVNFVDVDSQTEKELTELLQSFF